MRGEMDLVLKIVVWFLACAVYCPLVAVAVLEDVSDSVFLSGSLTTEIRIYGSPDVKIGDYDGDGLDDVFLTGSFENCPLVYTEQSRLYRNTGATLELITSLGNLLTYSGQARWLSKPSGGADLLFELYVGGTGIQLYSALNTTYFVESTQKLFPNGAVLPSARAWCVGDFVQDSANSPDVLFFRSEGNSHYLLQRVANDSFVFADPAVLANIPLIASYYNLLVYPTSIPHYRDDDQGAGLMYTDGSGIVRAFANPNGTLIAVAVPELMVANATTMVAASLLDTRSDVIAAGNKQKTRLFRNQGNGSFSLDGTLKLLNVDNVTLIDTPRIRPFTNPVTGWVDFLVLGGIESVVAGWLRLMINQGNGEFKPVELPFSSVYYASLEAGSSLTKPGVGGGTAQAMIFYASDSGSVPTRVIAYSSEVELNDLTGQYFASKRLVSFPKGRVSLVPLPETVSPCPVLFLAGYDDTDKSQSLLIKSLCNGTFVFGTLNVPAVGHDVRFLFDDLNGDGSPDYVMVGNDDLLNNYAHIFSFNSSLFLTQTVTSPFTPSLLATNTLVDLATLELTGDDYPELFVSASIVGGSISRGWAMYQNLGNLTFVEMTDRFETNATYLENTFRVLGLSSAIQSPPSSYEGGEFRKDVLLYAYGLYNTGYYHLYLNLFNGSFADRSSTHLLGAVSFSSFPAVVTVDADDNGLQDLAVVGAGIGSTQGNLLRNLGNRSYVVDTTWLPSGVGGGNCIGAWLDLTDDGRKDLFVSCSVSSYITYSVLLENMGPNQPLSDVTSQVLPNKRGFTSGNMVHGALAYNRTGYLVTGLSSTCGFMMVVDRPNTASSSSSTSGAGSEASAASSGASTDTATLLAAILGSVGGVAAILLILLAVCLLCCCVGVVLCFVCIACALMVVVAVVAVAGLGAFGSADAAGLGLLVVQRRKKRQKEAEERRKEALSLYEMGSMDADDTEGLMARAQEVDEYAVLEWSDLQIVRKLGEGAFGEVLLANWNGVEVAVKTFKNPSAEAIDDFQHEALMMARVSHHPHVVHFIGAAFTSSSIAMVMGLCAGGSLIGALEKGTLDSAAKKRVLRESASALAFLHSLGIVHRDIAARNILLDGAGHAKLADLGLSRLLQNNQDEQQTASYVGPVRWMAPEAISARKYSAKSDAYSFGVLMCEVWDNGALPLRQYASLADAAIALLTRGERPIIPADCPGKHVQLIQQLFSSDPNARPEMASVYQAFVLDEEAASEAVMAPSGNSLGDLPQSVCGTDYQSFKPDENELPYDTMSEVSSMM